MWSSSSIQGHAAPILYAAWVEAGYIKESDLLNLRKIDCDLEGHPTPVMRHHIYSVLYYTRCCLHTGRSEAKNWTYNVKKPCAPPAGWTWYYSIQVIMAEHKFDIYTWCISKIVWLSIIRAFFLLYGIKNIVMFDMGWDRKGGQTCLLRDSEH